MANCLVKEFKGSAQNASLLKVGEVFVHVKCTTAGQTREVTWNQESGHVRTLDGSSKIKINEDGSVYGDTVVIPANKRNRTIVFDSGEYDIAVGSIYDLRSLNFFTDTKISFTIDLNRIAKYSTALFGLECQESALRISLDYISSHVLELFNSSGTSANVSGSINHFNGSTTIKTLKVKYNSSNVTGNMNELLESLCAVRESGYINIEVGSTKVTFHDENVTRSTFYTVFSQTGCEVKDSSAGTVFATYNKSTGTWSYV